MAASSLIPPHGGTLINRFADADRARELKSAAASGLRRITLTTKQACDLEMIATGSFSPLDGFVGKSDFESICREARGAYSGAERALRRPGSTALTVRPNLIPSSGSAC